MKINLNIILIIALFITATGSALATNDGKGNNYLKRNVGIKERKPQAELHINGSLIMNDDNEATDNILRSDANGLASWVPIGAIPGIVANNGTVVNISLFNGFLQDAYLNGTTTIDGRLYFPAGFANGLILTMHANGNAHWEVNNGATIAVGNGEWLELANVLYPGDMTGAQNVAIG